jgi:hypothetical protein
MSQYTTSVCDVFFCRENVVASVKQCVKSLSYYTEDPLVSFANVRIQQPLCFTVTTQGLCPFENNVRIMIPYDSMSKAQLLVIQNLMDAGSARNDFVNCSHENGDFSVTTVSDRRSVSVDPSRELTSLCRISACCSASTHIFEQKVPEVLKHSGAILVESIRLKLNFSVSLLLVMQYSSVLSCAYAEQGIETVS